MTGTKEHHSNMIRSSLIAGLLISSVAPFLLEGLGLGGLGGGHGHCCCQPPPPPPPACGGGDGYEMPPPPPPPMPSYATAGGSYRKKRSLSGSSDDGFCNSNGVRDIIKQSMGDDEVESRKAITSILKTQLQQQFVVVCSKHQFDFQASIESEFCSITNDAGLTCSTFVF